MNHYKWLNNNLKEFFDKLNLNSDYCDGIISADGDKCYQYRDTWEKHGIPFNHISIQMNPYKQSFSPKMP
jgi:hypothetical protein